MQRRVTAAKAVPTDHHNKGTPGEPDRDDKKQRRSSPLWNAVPFIMLLLVGVFVFLRKKQQDALIPSLRVKPGVVFMQEAGGDTADIKELQAKVDEVDGKVRAYKKQKGMIMETDPGGLKLTKELQELTHDLIIARYGKHDGFRVQVDVSFPTTIPDYDINGDSGRIVIELAPIDLIPCSVYNFLEIARTWKSGAFHRNANHVLQVQANSAAGKSMPFQEYSEKFPHNKGTAGYAGRPSGPAWYVSIQDNRRNHGPGSQQHENPHEADALFGTVIEGFDDVVPRIHSIPQNGWLDKANQMAIPKMTILVPSTTSNEWVPWMPPS